MPDITKRTSQYIDNLSFDETYQEATVLPVVENAAGTALIRQKEIATEATLQAVAGEKANIIIVGDYIYEGNAAPGSATSASVWQISRFDKVNLITVWADGNTASDNIWDDYLTLSYS